MVFLEMILASIIGTLSAALFMVVITYLVVVNKQGDIEDKVDEKVEEKASEMMGGLFQ